MTDLFDRLDAASGISFARKIQLKELLKSVGNPYHLQRIASGVRALLESRAKVSPFATTAGLTTIIDPSIKSHCEFDLTHR